MKRIAVFCASSPGFDPEFFRAAENLGRTLAERGIGLVYGGAKIGLMGAVASAVLQHGGEAIGVLPHFLGAKEIAHDQLTELIMVDTMHERKTQMNHLCDGVIALPGGFGTLEELFEMLTWGQLGLHHKPVALLNVNGFYDPLVVFINSMVDKGLLKNINQNMLLVDDDMGILLTRMEQYDPPQMPKWIREGEQ